MATTLSVQQVRAEFSPTQTNFSKPAEEPEKVSQPTKTKAKQISDPVVGKINQKANRAISSTTQKTSPLKNNHAQGAAVAKQASKMPTVIGRVKPKTPQHLASTSLAKPASTQKTDNTATPSVQPPSPSATPTPPQNQTTLQEDAKRKAFEAAKAERLKLLEQKLAEIVAREKPLKEERMRENLRAIAIRQAEAGQLEQARKTAQDLVLTQEEQIKLRTQIDALAKRQPVAKKPTPRQSLRATVTQLNQSRLAVQPAPNYPTYVLPGPVLGSNLRLSQLGLRLNNGNLNLAFPLPFPAQLTSGFGWRTHPISGDRRFHRGVDLAAAYGTPVIAAFSGKVEVADWMDGYGMTIILTHKNSTQTLYAHLSEIFVKPGDAIEQGALIGRVGSTGLSTGPHLHFELHQLVDDSWIVIDPLIQLEVAQARLLKAMQTAQVPFQVAPLPQPFAAIPPPPTQRFDYLHNF
ncbi:peptidoglycan DD-metalloendopeptidase family protein [Leptothermofonsia sp. ETS-13]|uniref:M23 family metallopeptidase n=1 Tax=Leptothermofonsia sp. ETS-13 TaxID=3035696 RepID=UPI003BA269C6